VPGHSSVAQRNGATLPDSPRPTSANHRFNNRKRKSPNRRPPEIQPELAGMEPDIEIPERLPYIVGHIDELADLMMVAPAESRPAIARLPTRARRGIHLIIATSARQ